MARARNVSEWDHEYYSAYASGKHFLWGTEPEEFVKGVVDHILTKQKYSKNELRVLDLGCGKGRHYMYLSRLGLRVVGLDVSRVALHKGLEFKDKSELGFEFVLGDCHRLPFIEGSFDYILDVYNGVRQGKGALRQRNISNPKSQRFPLRYRK